MGGSPNAVWRNAPAGLPPYTSYEYRPPRPLEEIEADIQAVEKDIVAMLREVAS